MLKILIIDGSSINNDLGFLQKIKSFRSFFLQLREDGDLTLMIESKNWEPYCQKLLTRKYHYYVKLQM